MIIASANHRLVQLPVLGRLLNVLHVGLCDYVYVFFVFYAVPTELKWGYPSRKYVCRAYMRQFVTKCTIMYCKQTVGS